MDKQIMETISEISFFGEEVEIPFSDTVNKTLWLEKVLLSHDRSVGEINYIFCKDDYLLEINNKYLNHDYYTDVITFDYCENKIVSGDIYISIDMVSHNAKKFLKTQENELCRVMAHGVLHLCGLKDKSEDDALEMRKAEEDALAILGSMLEEKD